MQDTLYELRDDSRSQEEPALKRARADLHLPGKASCQNFSFYAVQGASHWMFELSPHGNIYTPESDKLIQMKFHPPLILRRLPDICKHATLCVCVSRKINK